MTYFDLPEHLRRILQNPFIKGESKLWSFFNIEVVHELRNFGVSNFVAYRLKSIDPDSSMIISLHRMLFPEQYAAEIRAETQITSVGFDAHEVVHQLNTVPIRFFHFVLLFF